MTLKENSGRKTYFFPVYTILRFFYFRDAKAPRVPVPPLYRGFTVILRHATLGRNPLICPTQRPLPDNSHIQRERSLLPAGFEPAIPADGWPKSHAIDRVAPVIGIRNTKNQLILRLWQILSPKITEISVLCDSL